MFVRSSELDICIGTSSIVCSGPNYYMICCLPWSVALVVPAEYLIVERLNRGGLYWLLCSLAAIFEILLKGDNRHWAIQHTVWTFNLFLSTSSFDWYPSHSSPHPVPHSSTMTQLAVTLFLEKWSALVAKHKGADLPSSVSAGGNEPEISLSDVDFGTFHCFYNQELSALYYSDSLLTCKTLSFLQSNYFAA